ncbi:MAG TPA: CbtA family protein [Reyranella sp.]
MLTRVLSVGLLAGLLAGLLIAVLQQVTTTPLILLAETYEKQGEAASAAPPAPGAAAGHDHAAHDHGWKPADGLPRFFYTAITTIATAVGVAFLLIAGMVFAGDTIDERRSLAWAIAGFVASGLAPAAGLAPELPGSAAGDLVGRQIWWIGTAVATALALWAFLRMESPVARLGAFVLLLAPHVIGAPHPHALESKVPAEIAAQFTALSLVVQGLLWAFAGIAVGLLWSRFAPRPASRPVPS